MLLNLVCFCSAILTMFQVPEAAGDPLTRWAAVYSLIFALMSLTFGIVYIVQFGTMRSMYKASRWAEVRRLQKAINAFTDYPQRRHQLNEESRLCK